MTDAPLTVTTADGRDLEVLVSGPDGGVPLVFHHGTPSSAVPDPGLAAAAAAHGLRLVTWSRPGYGASTPQPGRSVADVVPDTITVLDSVGAGDFVTLGWSGGGPHALACAALAADRCRGAAVLAGVAPYDAAGLDWLDGQGAENLEEWSAALQGSAALEAWLEPVVPQLAGIEPAHMAEGLGDLASDVDRRALTGQLAELLAAAMRHAVERGGAGWRDDDLAFLRPWGVDLDAITVPVTVWQGDQDRMVPLAHGHWLGEHVPGARLELLPGEGHLSVHDRLHDVVADLVSRAALTG